MDEVVSDWYLLGLSLVLFVVGLACLFKGRR
jgi:hypothetical protein